GWISLPCMASQLTCQPWGIEGRAASCAAAVRVSIPFHERGCVLPGCLRFFEASRMLHEKSSPVGGGGMAAEKNKREPMSKVDTAWLRMESPTNLMMITGVLIFRDRLALGKVRNLLA